MEINNIKVGMKVKLLGKHGVFDEYDNIEDWYEDCKAWEEVQRIKEQGYGIVSEIDEDGEIWVVDGINDDEWCFLSSDLVSYEDELTGKSTQIKSPKEWLLTTGVVFTTGDNNECVTLGNGTAYMLNGNGLWNDDLESAYTDNLRCPDYCPLNDIMKIEYKGKIVWERKVNYVSFDEAVKSGKRMRNERWGNFYSLNKVLLMMGNNNESVARAEITGLWEIEE